MPSAIRRRSVGSFLAARARTCRDQLARTAVGLVLALGCTTGCGTPLAEFGDQARYAPAYRGYVLASYSGSDDPPPGAGALLLRDPLSGEKLRCKEDVEVWRQALEDTASDLVQDDNAAISASVTGGIFMGHAAAVQPLGALGMLEGQLLAGMVYETLRSQDAPELVIAGATLLERKRYTMAQMFFERALLKDANVGVSTKAYFFMGTIYAKKDETERATLTLSRFVKRAAVRDVDAYREAEELLAELGEPAPAVCESVAPVKVYW